MTNNKKGLKALLKAELRDRFVHGLTGVGSSLAMTGFRVTAVRAPPLAMIGFRVTAAISPHSTPHVQRTPSPARRAVHRSLVPHQSAMPSVTVLSLLV